MRVNLSSEQSVVKNLLLRPDLPVLIEKLSSSMEIEKTAREKFLRELTPSVKCEFISGEPLTQSPAKAKHLRATKRLLAVLDRFVEEHRLGEVFSEKALISLTRNDYEPDIVFFSTEKSKHFTDDQMRFPAPDFVVEVLSDSTESRDRGVKFEDYAAHQVAEYWIVDCDHRCVEQYGLDESGRQYQLEQKIRRSAIESTVVRGFKMSVADLFS